MPIKTYFSVDDGTKTGLIIPSFPPAKTECLDTTQFLFIPELGQSNAPNPTSLIVGILKTQFQNFYQINKSARIRHVKTIGR